MWRLIMLLGFGSIFAAVVFLVGSLVATDNEMIAGTIESIACNPPEKLVIERDRWSLPNGERGENIRFLCEIEPGQQRSVTDTVIPMFIAIFTGLLLLGIVLITVSASRMVKKQSEYWTAKAQDYVSAMEQQGFGTVSTSSTVIDLRDKKNNIPPETQALLNNVLGGFANSFAQAGGKGSLTERLKQLDEAYNNDLISKEEYDRVRQAILDSMDD